MQTIVINNAAVAVAALSQFVLGFLWYGPLFGKKWIELKGFSKKDMEDAKKKGMAKTIIVSLALSIVTAYVLAHVVKYAGSQTALDGAQGGFWVWLGFVATITANDYLWNPKPKSLKLYVLDNSYLLISLAIMGAILAVWI